MLLKFSAETSKVRTEVSLDPPAKRSHLIPEVFFCSSWGWDKSAAWSAWLMKQFSMKMNACIEESEDVRRQKCVNRVNRWAERDTLERQCCRLSRAVNLRSKKQAEVKRLIQTSQFWILHDTTIYYNFVGILERPSDELWEFCRL